MEKALYNTMLILLSALNVKVKRFNEARVNSGSNYDSLSIAPAYVLANP